MYNILKKIMEPNIFRCECCSYSTAHRGDMRKHCLTIKHLTTITSGVTSNRCVQSTFICDCGKQFKYLRNLTRHRRTCGVERRSGGPPSRVGDSSETPKAVQENVDTLTDAVKTLVEENRKLSEQLKEFVPSEGSVTVRGGTAGGSVTNTIIGEYRPQYITAINDSQINMQVFLDKNYGQALNLTTFIETLRLNSQDLDETRERGLAYSLGRVLIRGLRELESDKRPIHCSNLRKSVMYVRDNDAWGLDTRETQIRNAIGILSSKQVVQIKDWEKDHPDWDNTETGKRLYADTVHKIFQVAREADKEKIENQVIKTIAKETLVDG